MDATTYHDRRRQLREAVHDGEILLLGNLPISRNYADAHLPFRQDSNFLYFTGISQVELGLVIGEDGSETLFGPAAHPDDLVWFGARPSLGELAEGAGVASCGSPDDLSARLQSVLGRGGAVHYLPPYRADRVLQLAALLGVSPAAVRPGASPALVREVVAQRSIKSDAEVAEIEDALTVTAEMYRAALAVAKPGVTEAAVVAALQAPAMARERQLSFTPIVTIRGEVLHNEGYGNPLEAGNLLLIDSGAESPLGYAGDITRTFPVTGRFAPEQRDIYEVVLGAQLAAIAAASPETTNREVHLVAARTIASGLREVGLMRGNVDEAVAAGAHALFFPHGIGHMLGLDVHDMEDLGDAVGYPDGEARSTQFGLNFLRLAKRLEPGFVITVEPGVYFIPALIDRWRREGRHAEFIRYDRVQAFRSFGGVRIEDDVLITGDGSRVLGPGIPKTVQDIEQAARG
jgi:Xaa-Pro aminopeptidase